MVWTREMAIEQMKKNNEIAVKRGYNTFPIPEKFTCDDCADKDVCDWAWDLYNTNGDCLATK